MHESVIKLNHLNLASIQFGSAEHPRLLALHGWLDNAMSFAPLAPFLDDLGIQALEFPGHGHSDHFSSELPYHFIDAVIHMMELIDHYGWKNLILLGHSMGGGIATLLAGMMPERIKHVIIIEGLGPLTEPEATVTGQVLDYFRRHKKLRDRDLTHYPSVDAMAQTRAQKGYIRLEHAKLLSERGSKQTNRGWVWRHDPKLYLPSPIRLTENQVLACFAEIKAPTCFIYGEEGFRFDEKKMAARQAAIRNLVTHQVAGGHHCHMEYPEAVAEIIRGFCASSSPNM